MGSLSLNDHDEVGKLSAVCTVFTYIQNLTQRISKSSPYVIHLSNYCHTTHIPYREGQTWEQKRSFKQDDQGWCRSTCLGAYSLYCLIALIETEGSYDEEVNHYELGVRDTKEALQKRGSITNVSDNGVVPRRTSNVSIQERENARKERSSFSSRKCKWWLSVNIYHL